MKTSKAPRCDKRVAATTINRKTALVTIAVLFVMTAGGALASWTGMLSLGQKKKQEQAEKLGIQSFASGSPSKEYIYDGGRLVATEEPIPSCTYSISPSSASFTSTGGTGSVTVTATAGCGWTAAANDAWISITSGSSGTGNGTVNYSVAANAGGTRNGTMTIAGQTFTVTQSGPSCTYSISPTSQSFTSTGGTGSVTVTATAGCGWTAAANDAWISITSGSSGTGNGTVNYSVVANVGGARNGTMTIAGQTFTVTQDAAGCSYSVTPASQNFIAAGGTGSETVTAGAGCGWTAVSNATAWITITSGNSGSGNGSVGYSVAANTGPGRSGTMTIAGQTVTITQDSGCSFSINPPSANYNTSGGSGSVTVTANNQSCSWVAISNNTSWITVTSGASGTGNGTVGYSVAANTGSARSGSISIATQLFSVTQDGAAVGCQVTAFSGSGAAGYAEGSGTSAIWNNPVSSVVAKSPTSGNPNALFIADTTNSRIRMIYITGASAGTSILIAGDGTAGYSESPARYNHPQGLTAVTDANGVAQTLLIADTDNHIIRKLAWNGSGWTSSTFSGTGGAGPGYVDSTNWKSCRYNGPQGIVAASSTVIYVADTGNSAIRKLASTGTSSTQSTGGQIMTPVGVAVTASDGKYLIVSDTGKHDIWKVYTPGGTSTKLAGSDSAGFADGTGSGASFNSPRHLVYTSGTIYVADRNNQRIRKLIESSSAVTTLAGSGTAGNANGACGSATFNNPCGVGYGPSGEIYITDSQNNLIRKVQP